MNHTRRSRRGRLIVRLAIVTAILALGLAGAEGICRWSLPARTAPIRFEQARSSIERTLARKYGYGKERTDDRHTRSLRFEEVFQDDPELFWRFRPDVRLPATDWPLFGIVSNAQCLREDHPIPESKPQSEIRILFLGDSCTFGFLLDHRQTVCDFIERGLRERFPDLSFECVNAGVPGYSLFQGWRFLETRGHALEPDLVVLHFGWNGSGTWDGRSDLEHWERMQATRPPAALRWSRFAQWIWKRAYGGEGNDDRARRPRHRLLDHEFRELLERIQRSTRDHGEELLLLIGANRVNVGTDVPAHARSPFQMEQYEFAEERPFGSQPAPSYVDGVAILQALRARHSVAELFLDDVHPTELANRALAEGVLAKLVPWVRDLRKE